MKTILISSFHSLISRNILNAGVLPLLLREGIRVVLLVPQSKIEYFQKSFDYEGVEVVGINVPEKPFEGPLFFLSLSLVGVNNQLVWEWKTRGSYLKYYIANSLNILFRHFFVFHRFLRFFAKFYLRNNIFEPTFSQYQPDLVCATDIFGREDRSLLIEAKRRKIKTVGLVRSWDNATTKGVLLSEPDFIVTPNGVLRDELISIHQVQPGKIKVAGIPHYDQILSGCSVSREDFFAEMGLDIKKKTILFAPGGKILYKHDKEILADLEEYLTNRDFCYPVQFLVRLPPGDRVDISGVVNNHNFIIDDPGTDANNRKKEREMTEKDNQRLNCSLYYSDIVLTLISTMVIDGVSFNKPVVVWGFEPAVGLSDPIKKFTKYAHFKKLIETGLVTVAYSREEFLKQINAFLENPDVNKDDRQKILDAYTYKLDGHSAERVSQIILNLLQNDVGLTK